jgi:signal transduction histidine kinase
VRHNALAGLCETLARKSRIHAALEDDALDLLYPSGHDELNDVMGGDESTGVFNPLYYRFLDARGAVINPPEARDPGVLEADAAAQLALRRLPARAQTGYLWRHPAGHPATVDEIIAMPVVSSESGEVIAALVMGFKPVDLAARRTDAAIRSGLWVAGRCHLPAFVAAAQDAIAARLAHELAAGEPSSDNFTLTVEDEPYRLFFTRLNPGSLFPPAYEVCLYPLAETLRRRHLLYWQYAGVGLVLLGGAYGASRVFSRRLSVPVEQLAEDSELNRTGRQRAEAALELSHEELQRSARFSANASHQLKTPVSVLRAGLEDLLAEEKLTPEMREEVSALVHQTSRLNHVIEDLLLLSRLDAGRLHLETGPVDLIPLIEGWRDDLGTLPAQADLQVDTDLPPALRIEGEARYASLILQNLLENARKYNRPGGRIRLAATTEGGWVRLRIANTGAPIPAAAQEHIFERFHRSGMEENVPGHGLGLNLARELARRHGGDVRLVRSDGEWTEFEVSFRPAPPPVRP